MEQVSSEDLAATGAAELVRVSASIPRAAPRTFALLTACLVWPLSIAVLAHTLFADPLDILLRFHHGVVTPSELPQWLRLWAYHFLYLVALYTFSILSTAAAVFTVASLYANKPASMSSSLTAMPLILPRLLHTFACVPLLMGAYHLVFVLTVFGLINVCFVPNNDDAPDESPPLALPLPFLLCNIVVAAVFVGIHDYVSALWHLAGVVSVVEPLCGLAALAKSKRLLHGRTGTATTLVGAYMTICGVTLLLFRDAVVEGSFGLALPWRLLVGAVLVCVLVCVNLLGLLVQSVFYYSCKAFHNQKIDRTELYEHLGGYLGETLKSNILQMENL